jgi:hypothetical protein
MLDYADVSSFSIFHFTLFVWACVDTRRRNEGNKAGVIALAMQMAEQQQQQQQYRASMMPYAQAQIPPNMVMVPIDQWQQMQMKMGHMSMQPIPKPSQSPVSPIGGSPQHVVVHPTPVAH